MPFRTPFATAGERFVENTISSTIKRHPLASSEALVVIHRSMRPALHRRIRMVVEIVVNLPAFFVTSISLLATIIDK
jgi:hypothetical protein